MEILALFIGLIILVFLPIGITDYFRKKKEREKFDEFITSIEGQSFFCYNNKQHSSEFIKTNVLPHLSPKINIVYLNGRQPESGFNSEYISKILYSFKKYDEFPHLFKIEKRNVIEKSINTEFNKIIHHQKEKDFTSLIDEINSFNL